MKVAIPVAEGKLAVHFGHVQEFALVHVNDGKIEKTESLTPPPHEPGVLPRWVESIGATLVIAGGMGHKAQQLFAEKNIKVLTGAPSEAPEVLVRQYLENCLQTGVNLCDH
ncbi:NifB/NifX family molybdenum-iron cluster-binding protein [Desulfobotulus mexicanus]|uniref:ATPase n=1 Tax=Desulfobotulus mexicanus TaxID=2586642 RepID=A0A5S5MFQ8_9BACT|nr:NifB/NifX family molybdenum-iron cluster-binding protein [Desulfobotulus mexicanus]TYT74528.1 ATPase [Desulfobotulus mexicanus]